MSVKKLIEELSKYQEVLTPEDYSQIEIILEKYREKAPEISFEEELKNIEEANALKDEGNTYFKKTDYHKAIEKYTAAIKKDPKNKVLYSNRSACYHKLEHTQKGIADAQKSVELDPFYAKGYYRLGILHTTVDPEKSLAFFEKALECEPNNSEYKQCVNSAHEKLNGDNQNLSNKEGPDLNSQLMSLMSDPGIRSQMSEMMKDPMISKLTQELKKSKSPEEIKELETRVLSHLMNKK